MPEEFDKQEERKEPAPEKNGDLRNIDRLAKNVSSWWTDGLVVVTKTRIKTWKGALMLAFFSGSVIATVWGFSGSYFQGSLAGISTSFLLDPPSDTVQVDEVFDLDAVINTDNEDVVAVKAVINYDENSFELQNVDTSNSVFAVDNPCQYQGKACEIIERDDANGQVIITLSKPTPGINTASGIIATLTFRALQATSPGSDNFTFAYSSLGNYTDSDMVGDDGSGTDTLDTVVNARVTVTAPPPPACTDFTYSSWGACQPDDTQARTVATSLPNGCSGGSPMLTQACTYVAPTCTDFTYSSWGACQPDDTQARTVMDSTPQGCSGGSPVLAQTCTFSGGPTTCTDFTYSSWGTCQPDDTQARTVATSLPNGCSGGSPILTQACAYVVVPLLTCTSFTYSNWSSCSIDGIQSRSVASRTPDSCTGGDPDLEQDCTPAEEDEGNVEVVNSDQPINIEGEKQKFGKAAEFYSDSRNISFKGESDDIKNGKVRIYEGNDLKKEIEVASDGKWKTDVKVKNDDNYKFRLEYYNSAGNKVADSKKYEVKVDTKDPKFTDLPLLLNKKRADKIWWKAEDNRKIDHFKIEFLGRIKNTERSSFNVPADAPRGLHILTVRAYDKAGNRTTRRVTILVR